MIYYAVKILITSVLVAMISEASKRSSFLGALLASIPLVSLLAMVWLYRETRDAARVAALSTGIFWLVLPSLPFFLIFPYLLKLRWNFYMALATSTGMMVGLYFLMVFVSGKLGMRL